MAWMDVYEEAAFRTYRYLEDTLSAEYDGAFREQEDELDADGWAVRGEPAVPGEGYFCHQRGDFIAFVVPGTTGGYEVIARGPAGHSSGLHHLTCTEQEAKAYGLELRYVLRARLLEGARA